MPGELCTATILHFVCCVMLCICSSWCTLVGVVLLHRSCLVHTHAAALTCQPQWPHPAGVTSSSTSQGLHHDDRQHPTAQGACSSSSSSIWVLGDYHTPCCLLSAGLPLQQSGWHHAQSRLVQAGTCLHLRWLHSACVCVSLKEKSAAGNIMV